MADWFPLDDQERASVSTLASRALRRVGNGLSKFLEEEKARLERAFV
jgi:hypothetical protein